MVVRWSMRMCAIYVCVFVNPIDLGMYFFVMHDFQQAYLQLVCINYARPVISNYSTIT